METEHNNRAFGQPSGNHKDVDQYSIHSLSSRPNHSGTKQHRDQGNNQAQMRPGSMNINSTKAGTRLHKGDPSSGFSVNSDPHPQQAAAYGMGLKTKLGTATGQVQSMANGMHSRQRSKGAQFNMGGKQPAMSNGQLHQHYKAHQKNNSGSGNNGSFFQLSRDAYNKLNANYSQQQQQQNAANVSQGIHEFKGHHAGLKERPQATRTADVKLQDRHLQEKFDEVCKGSDTRNHQNMVGQNRNGKVASMQMKFATDQISPIRTAQMNQRGGPRRVQSVRRNERPNYNTLQGENVNAYITGAKVFTDQASALNNTIVAEPRFKMYNQDYIKDHLDRRRRSASHNRQRNKRFSTIEQGREENRTHLRRNIAQYAESFQNQKTTNTSNNKQYEFGDGPAFSIPSQVYPNRTGSPEKLGRDVTPRGRAVSSRSPNRNDQTLLSSTMSDGETTPGCTDYSPNYNAVLKKLPGQAIQTSRRFFKPVDKTKTPDRPHVYEDPNQRTFRRSNSGSFGRATRFKTPISKEQIKNYLLTLTGNDGFTSENPKQRAQSGKFRITSRNQSYGGFGGTQGVNNFAQMDISPTQVATRIKPRPGTEVGRRRFRPGQDDPSTTAVTDPNGQHNELSAPSDQGKHSDNSGRAPSKKFVTLSQDERTPRFSVTNRTVAKSPHSTSDFNLSPGPACYETRVDSCHRKPQRQPSFTTEKRFLQLSKPAAQPEAGFYDTRPAVHLLLKKGPTVCIPTQKRMITPHLFHAKNSKAIMLGVTLKE